MEFGIEIELRGEAVDAKRALRSAGLSIADYSDGDSEGWIVKSEHCGFEVTRGYLTFENVDHREEVSRAVRALRDVATATESTGIHVHVDCDGIDPLEATALARTFYDHQDSLYRLATADRGHMRSCADSYAIPVNAGMVSALETSFLPNMSEVQRLWDNAFRHNRYCGLNLLAYGKHGTVEFRLWNSTTNVDYVQAFIATSVALVRGATQRLTTDPAAGTGDSFKSLLTSYGMSDVDRERVTRCYDGSPVVETHTSADVGIAVCDAGECFCACCEYCSQCDEYYDDDNEENHCHGSCYENGDEMCSACHGPSSCDDCFCDRCHGEDICDNEYCERCHSECETDCNLCHPPFADTAERFDYASHAYVTVETGVNHFLGCDACQTAMVDDALERFLSADQTSLLTSYVVPGHYNGEGYRDYVPARTVDVWANYTMSPRFDIGDYRGAPFAAMSARHWEDTFVMSETSPERRVRSLTR